ncbi:hypothetical protein ElyMa_000386600 [Elysia marginata]|uniref:Uncharacterized protein n=1 Tax=Elysia marginata TaxID=1093978 RepID=A0AAV4FIT1_9GAST|nr:hypothetical protein ElyMa_000386600 [Elysia marginata]
MGREISSTLGPLVQDTTQCPPIFYRLEVRGACLVLTRHRDREIQYQSWPDGGESKPLNSGLVGKNDLERSKDLPTARYGSSSSSDSGADL